MEDTGPFTLFTQQHTLEFDATGPDEDPIQAQNFVLSLNVLKQNIFKSLVSRSFGPG